MATLNSYKLSADLHYQVWGPVYVVLHWAMNRTQSGEAQPSLRISGQRYHVTLGFKF